MPYWNQKRNSVKNQFFRRCQNSRNFTVKNTQKQFAGTAVPGLAKTAIDGTAKQRRRSLLLKTAPPMLVTPAGRNQCGVSRASRTSARCRLDDTSPCPERQVEKLSLLLWPVQKGRLF
jgi:hypothetical protein